MLFHGHVPILNVEYGSEGRAIGGGPTYRDWQTPETPFEANGTNVAPGFVLCPTPACTIIDNGTDLGNFAGVAIYVDGQEVVLVSEMQAGWYRYITEWRLHSNGTIRPRFGFAGTENRCTCNLHTHHVYWRLDFDIRTPSHNVASADVVTQERARHAAENGAAIVAPSNMARFVDPLAGAFLARDVHAFVLRIDAANAGIADMGFGVKPDRCSCEKRDQCKAFHGGSFGWCEHILPART